MQPQISIITVCYNSASTIESTIQSVLSQVGVDVEYIIVDGGSADSTLDIVNKYKDKIAKVVSEPDKGLYDAMNKGIALATGHYIGILNSDDYFAFPTVLKIVWETLASSRASISYGNITIVDRIDTHKIERVWRSGEFSREQLVLGYAPPHPGMFVAKSVYDKIGCYDLKYKIAADFDFMVRAFIQEKIQPVYIDKFLVTMRSGGVSSGAIRGRVLGWMELVQILKKHGVLQHRWFLLYRIWYKLKQLTRFAAH